MVFTTNAASLRRLPLFLAHMPDYIGPEVLSRRLGVRERHLGRWQEDLDSGIGEFGSGYLPIPTSTLFSNPGVDLSANGLKEPIAGSVMIFRAEDLDKAWERIRGDIYWVEKVWDREKGSVVRFLGGNRWVD